jgi:hypothetical protein
MTDSDVRYCYSSWNASSASWVQTKSLDFRRSLKNRRACFASLEINRLSAARHPVSFWTTLIRARVRITSIALIFSGLASILRCEIRKPSCFPTENSNTLLFGFNFVRVERNLSKTKARLSNRDVRNLILTTMS